MDPKHDREKTPAADSNRAKVKVRLGEQRSPARSSSHHCPIANALRKAKYGTGEKVVPPSWLPAVSHRTINLERKQARADRPEDYVLIAWMDSTLTKAVRLYDLTGVMEDFDFVINRQEKTARVINPPTKAGRRS